MDKIDHLTNSFISFHAVKNVRNELHPHSCRLGYYANQFKILISCLFDLGERTAANLILDYSQSSRQTTEVCR